MSNRFCADDVPMLATVFVGVFLAGPLLMTLVQVLGTRQPGPALEPLPGPNSAPRGRGLAPEAEQLPRYSMRDFRPRDR